MFVLVAVLLTGARTVGTGGVRNLTGVPGRDDSYSVRALQLLGRAGPDIATAKSTQLGTSNSVLVHGSA